MKKMLLILIIASAGISSNTADAQPTTKQMTITMKDGRVFHAETKSLNLLSDSIDPSAIQKITIVTSPRNNFSGNNGFYFQNDGQQFKLSDTAKFRHSPSIRFQNFSANAGFLGVQTADDEKGARIEEVVAGSPAEKAGLMKGDIITKVGDENIDGGAKLSEVIRGMKPDQTVKISILRDGKKKEVTAVLSAQSFDMFQKNLPLQIDSLFSPRNFRYFYNAPDADQFYNMPNLYNNGRRFGRPQIQDFNLRLPNKQSLGLQIQDTEDETGVTILKVEPNSPAEKAGVRQGDLLTEVNGSKVKNVAEALKQINQVTSSEYKLDLMRNKKHMTVTVKIPRQLRKADI